MGLLDHLWDDTVAGPRPENGLGKLRKHHTFTFRPSSGNGTPCFAISSRWLVFKNNITKSIKVNFQLMHWSIQSIRFLKWIKLKKKKNSIIDDFLGLIFDLMLFLFTLLLNWFLYLLIWVKWVCVDQSDGGNVRSYGEDSPDEAVKVTRSIMIVKPPGYQGGSAPVSPAGSTPPVSPFSGEFLIYHFDFDSMIVVGWWNSNTHWIRWGVVSSIRSKL